MEIDNNMRRCHLATCHPVLWLAEAAGLFVTWMHQKQQSVNDWNQDSRLASSWLTLSVAGTIYSAHNETHRENFCPFFFMIPVRWLMQHHVCNCFIRISIFKMLMTCYLLEESDRSVLSQSVSFRLKCRSKYKEYKSCIKMIQAPS